MKKKKHTPPNYDPLFSPFIIRLEAAILRDGFEDIKSFVRFHIYEGRNFSDIQQLIKEKYNLKVHWHTIRRNLREFAPRIYRRTTTGHIKRLKIAKSRGHQSVSGFIKHLISKGYNNNDFARVFNINPERVTSCLKMYPVDLSGKEILPDMEIFGMKQQKKYIKWLKIAKQLNFDSVPECIVYLIKEKGLSLREVGFLFGVSRQAMLKKINNSAYLCRKLKS